MEISIIKDNNGHISKQLLWGLILIGIGIILLIVSLIIGVTLGIYLGIAGAIIGFFLRRTFYTKQELLESKKLEEEDKKKLALRRKERALQRKEEQERKEEEIWDFKDANGECDKLIIHNNFRLEVYDKAQKVIFKGTLYSFSDILSCELIEKEIIKTKSIVVGQKEEVTTTYTTTTSGKSLAGRAIAGAIVAGPVGAIIGGATAKRTTVAENQVTSRPVMGTEEYKSMIYKLLIKTTKSKSVHEFVTSQKTEAEEIKEVFDTIIKTNTISA